MGGTTFFSTLLTALFWRHGSIQPLTHTYAWRNAELIKLRDNFNFTLPYRTEIT
jgi:hypothetical protein